MISCSEIEMVLFDMIPHSSGMEGADGKRVTQKELMALMHFPSTREVRLAVQNLRLQGYPVLADGRGYYISESLDDTRRFCSTMRRKAFGILKSIGKLENATLVLSRAERKELDDEC